MTFRTARLLLPGLLVPALVATLLAPAAPAAAPEAAPAVMMQQDPPAEREGLFAQMPTLPEAVRVAVLDERYDEALESIRAFQRADDGARDFWFYLEGVVLARTGDHTAAVQAYATVVREHAEGPWRHKARFRMADSLRAQGDWQGAERIFEEEVARLRGDLRQGELADIYLGFADELSMPSDANPDPQGADLDRALALYRRVLDLQPPADKLEQALRRIAEVLSDKQAWGEAAGAWQAYLAEFDPLAGAPEDTADDAGVAVYEAHRDRAAALRNSGDPRGARRAFEDLAARLGARLDSGPVAEAGAALRALQGDALYAVSRCFGGQEHDAVIGALRRYLEVFPREHRYAADARFRVAERLFEAYRYDDALAALQDFLAWQPASALAEEDAERAARLRVRADFLVAETQMERGEYQAAAQAYASYVGRHPAGADWAEAQQGIVNADYARGAELREQQQWQAARAAWTDFLERRPLDPDARSIFFDIGDLHREEAYAMEEGAAGRGQAFRSAIAHWQRLVSKYPGSDEASQALYETGQLYENELGELEEAVAAYRRCDFGPYASAARTHLMTMVEASLAVVTERTWRADEPARLKVHARNLETLEVQVYPLDLESYFRKHLTHRSVEDLDLDLIAPSRSFEIDLEGYARWKPLSQEIEIPVEGPGTWAVAVSSGTLRATTLVVRSDIDVLVKSSRDDMLLWAEDMRAQAPAAGTRFLVAFPGAGEGGAPRIEQATAGEDGVARLDLGALGIENVDDVRVLATRDGHVASTQLGLWGLGATQGARPRAFVWADRSMYRPGDEVRWRAVVRDAVDGGYVVRPGERYLVTVSDAQSRVVMRERMDLSDYGTLHGALRLDEAASTGGWRVTLEAPDGRAFQGVFQVARFQLPKVALELEFDREVYYRGETVTGTARAAWHYGEPVADAPLQVQLPDGRRLDLRTDAEGAAEFRFDTRGQDNSGVLPFTATLPEEAVVQRGMVRLSTTGFGASVTVPRGVVLAGESVPVSVRTFAAGGDPVARTLTLEAVLHDEDGRGSWVPRTVDTRELTTSEEAGSASATLSLERGGVYTLRVSGVDRFSNPIVSETSLFVSGEDDEVRLRVFADSGTVKVGEPVSMTLHNRAGPGLALVTFEGEGVLGYRVVELGDGANALEMEVGHEHFPNFTVAAAMMESTHLHTASAPFRVSRQLQVRVLPSAQSYRPGEQAEVKLEVTDQLGRPVQAELSLSVVDAALFARFPDRSGNLREFFENDLYREAEMRTESSIGFRYVGETVEIEEAVLEEAQLELARDAWDSRRGEALNELRDKAARRPQPPASPAPDGPMTAGRARSGLAPQQLAELGYVLEEEESEFGAWRGPSDSIGLGGGAGGQFGGRGGRGRREVEGVDAASAYWNPSIVTDADGLATVRFALPERSTRWRLMARGVGDGTTLGQSATHVVSKADFFVEMRAPAQLTAGDRPQVLARVHNATGATGPVQLQLSAEVDGQRLIGAATLQVDGDGVFETLLALPEGLDPAGVADATLVLEATPDFDAEVEPYAVERSVRVAPWGVERRDAEGGLLASTETLELQLPEGDYRDVQFVLQLGGGVDRVLIDEALGRAPRPWHVASMPLTTAATAGDLIGVLATLRHLEQGGNADGADFLALRERAAALVATLVARQREDGSWTWAPMGIENRQRVVMDSAEPTSRAMWALAAARGRGMVVPPATLEAGVRALRSAQQAAGTQDDERRAMLLHALTVAGAGDFAVANRLHRVRNSLSTAALAYTALALAGLDSDGMADEVAQELEARWAEGEGFTLAGNRGWHLSPVENAALALLALQAARPASGSIEPGIDRLLARRPWPTDSAGVATAALAEWRTSTTRRDEAAEVTVQVGDGEARTLELRPGASHLELTEMLAAGARSVTVRLDKSGRGDVHFLAELRGFSRTLAPGGNEALAVRDVRYLAPHVRYRGLEHRDGFSVVQDVEGWENSVSSVGLGDTARYAVRFVRYDRGRDSDGWGDYLIFEVPYPAGTQVLEDSVRGSHLSWHEQDGRLVFRFDRNVALGDVSFELLGTVPGEYRVLPPVLREAYRPTPASYGQATAFTVRPRDVVGDDDYRPTPDELLSLGRAMFQAGDLDGAWQRLVALYDGYAEKLYDAPLREAADMLLVMAVEREEPNRIVGFFEVLKEKYPELTVPFDRMLRVGEAYREIGEFERAYLVFRAIVEETYGKDLKLAGTLEEQGDFHAASEMLLRLWTEYPDAPAVVETHLTLADMLLAKAPTAHEDASLRGEGIDRALLTTDGIFLLQRFLALYAEDPLAADAALNLVSAYLDLEDYATAASLSEEMSGRFREPRFVDAFQYTRAVASWYLGRDDVAVGLLQGIAGAVYTDAQGRESRSENRDLALYILGQIHHAKQEYGQAAEYYEQVAEVFSDAREVLAGFRTRDVRLEEVTTARPGRPVQVDLTFRNVEEAELLVYAVDLMTLYLREKNLTGITSVNLAGIAPIEQRSVALKPDGSMREQTAKVGLDLSDPGAYLVICRSGALHASGMVLVSDLELEVSEDPVSGRLRVQALDQADGSFVRDVDVRVVGSNNERFTSGVTDPRGMFVADEVAGRSTVIARFDDRHFAFFRGEQVLGQVEANERQRADRQQLLDNDDFLDNVRGLNSLQQQGRKRSYEEELKKGREGVQVKQVK